MYCYEIEKFKEYLEDKLLADANSLIRYTFNLKYPLSDPNKSQEFVMDEQYSKLILDHFNDIADRYNLIFDLEWDNDRITNVKWHFGNKKLLIYCLGHHQVI